MQRRWLIISLDTSAYPKDHTYICFALDDVQPALSRAIEQIGSYSPKTLEDTIKKILKDFARALNGHPQESQDSQPVHDDSESEDGYDDDIGAQFGGLTWHNNLAVTSALKRQVVFISHI